MKIIVVGSGGFARKHAAILSSLDDVTVVGFVGRSLSRAETAARTLAGSTNVDPAPLAFDSLETALERTRPDAAVIATTPDAHGPIELELVTRSIPFLVEKPIGVERQIPEQIAAAVERAGLVTSVGFHLRYFDTTAALLTMLRATTPVIATGFWMGTLPGVPWWRHLAESGGQFVEQAVHIIDLVRLCFGEAESVVATTTQRAIQGLHADADVPDAGATIVTMRSGLTVTLATSCMGPTSLRIGLDVVAPDALYQYGLGNLTVRRAHETIETRSAIDPYRCEDEVFVNAVRTGSTDAIRSSYADALQTHRLTMAIIHAATSGERVHLT